jgi:hypothetical protein
MTLLYTTLSNHVLSFSRALKRWEIVFFCSLSISAYLMRAER